MNDSFANTLISDELILKYATSGPRYTSYPTAVEFSSSVNPLVWFNAWKDDVAGEYAPNPTSIPFALSLYVHIPFCYKMCYFCACHKIVPSSRDIVAPYISAIKKELDLYKNLIPSTSYVAQIHWGGGSPDYLTEYEIEDLHNYYLNSFPNVCADADISIELDPRTTTKGHITTLAKLKFNRISIGVQDFDLKVQACINRVQSFEQTKDVIELARLSGIENINIDLVYGLPEQTLPAFLETLARIIELRPSRIALYGYAHVTWIKKIQKTLEHAHIPTPNERVTLFINALNTLTSAGYVYIGMDHFALLDDSLVIALRTKKLNRNFMGYSTHKGARILGLGASSISCLPTGYAQNQKDIDEYIKTVELGQSAIVRGLIKSRDDCLRGEIIETILCSGELDINDFESRWHMSFWQMFESSVQILENMQKDGLLILSKNKIMLTPRGRILARNIAMIFDAYLEKHRATNKKVFSQAV